MADGGVGPADGAQACAPPGETIYTEALAEVVCRLVAEGQSLRAVAGRVGMPHRTTIRNWANGRPEFAARLMAAMRTARLAARAADRAQAAARAQLPVPVTGGKPSTYTPEVGEAICARIANGESVVGIGRDPAMPCAGTVYAWVKRHPEFQDMYTTARELQAHYLFDEAREVALATTPATASVGRLQFDVIRWQAAKLAPRKYVERVVVAKIAAETKAAEQDDDGVVRILMTSFERSPKDPKKILAYPPRNAREAEAYLEAYGEPYSGPDEVAPEDDWRLKEAHHQRRRRRLAQLNRRDDDNDDD